MCEALGLVTSSCVLVGGGGGRAQLRWGGLKKGKGVHLQEMSKVSRAVKPTDTRFSAGNCFPGCIFSQRGSFTSEVCTMPVTGGKRMNGGGPGNVAQ